MIKSYTLSPRILLSAYIPLALGCVLLCVCTLFGLGHNQAIMGYTLANAPEFTILLTLPHILASFFSFFDKSYIVEYRRKLLLTTQVTIALSLVVGIFSLRALFYVFAIYTMYHVFKQQSGIARLVSGTKSNVFKYWHTVGLVISILTYISIYTNISMNGTTLALCSALVCIYMGLAVPLLLSSRQGDRRVYLASTAALPIYSFCAYMLHYPLLAVLVPRLVHDMTAYMFYITHDTNRWQEKRANIIYRLANLIGLTPTYACPFLSIILALVVYYLLGDLVRLPLMFLFLLHYGVESYIWKGRSLHKIHIAYATV